MNHKTKQFLDLLDCHKRLIYKVVNAYCKDKALHEDLTQEIILRLWSSFDHYDRQYKISTWIYRIALNTAISFYRKGANESRNSIEFSRHHENTLISETPSEGDPKLHLLNQFIQELKEVDKALILLYLDGYSHKEIAEIVGISPTNVGTKLTRIKKVLRKKINQN